MVALKGRCLAWEKEGIRWGESPAQVHEEPGKQLLSLKGSLLFPKPKIIYSGLKKGLGFICAFICLLVHLCALSL